MRFKTLWLCAVLALLGVACGGGGDDVAAFCDAGNDMESAASLEEFQEGFAALVEDAPDEIADDVERVAEAFEGASDEAALGEIMSDPELVAAFERIGEYGEENCETE